METIEREEELVESVSWMLYLNKLSTKFYNIYDRQLCFSSRKHACIILTPLNPTFI